MIDKFIFDNVLNFVCWLLLFIYRESAIAGLCFWVIIGVFINIIFSSTSNRHETFLIISRVVIFYLSYSLFVFYFSCIICIMLITRSIWHKTKHHFCVSLIIYLITLILCFFLIPAVQMS
jgi:uncharacterized membrane protein